MAYTPVWPAWKDSMACRSNDHGLSLLNGIVDSFRLTDLKSRTNRWFPFFVILDIRPAPPCIPQIRPLADLSLHLAVTLFNGAFELVQIAFNLQEIVIREFSPVLLKMSLELTPTLFELLRVHDAILKKTACPLLTAFPVKGYKRLGFCVPRPVGSPATRLRSERRSRRPV